MLDGSRAVDMLLRLPPRRVDRTFAAIVAAVTGSLSTIGCGDDPSTAQKFFGRDCTIISKGPNEADPEQCPAPLSCLADPRLGDLECATRPHPLCQFVCSKECSNDADCPTDDATCTSGVCTAPVQF